MANIILTNFVVCIKGCMFAYCITSTKNSYTLKLAFQNISPNHALFRNVSLDIQVKVEQEENL